MTAITSRLHFVEIEPPVPAKHTIIWLHGLGADGNDFVPIVSELNLPANNGIRFIFPHAPIMPVTLNNGYEMRAWYDIYSLTNNHRVDESGIVQSLTSINELIEAEIARGISSSNILLAGFSQGAAIALTAGLHYQQTLAGIIALSGYLPLMEKTFDQANESNRKIPIFIAHGTQDSVVPYAAGKAAETLLRQAGYTVEWHHYAMQHSVCAEEMNDIGQWIKNILF